MLLDYEITQEGAKLFRPPVLDLEAVEEKLLFPAGLREGKDRYQGQDAMAIVSRAVQCVLRASAGEEGGAVLPAVRISDCVGVSPDGC